MKDGKYIVLYSGTLDVLRGVDRLLNAVPFIRRSDVQLWITGRGPLEASIAAAVKKDIDRTVFLGFLPRDEFLSILRLADICINPQRPDLELGRYCFPSKVLEYLSLGKVVITTPVGDIASYLKDYVLFLEDTEPSAIARKIEEALDNFETLSQMARNGSKFLCESLSVSNQAQRLERFLDTLL